jgi:enoyl-CoA hydratase|tara:strand:+ start:6003 stop:6668 length:666 start_codon:yes stop_codon:yes gene_type:complete
MSVSLNISDDIALITMDDGKANAVSNTMLEALEHALNEAEQKAEAVVLAGRPGLFCAGFDLKIMKGGSDEDRAALGDRGGWLVHRLYSFPKPTIAAATGHGIALGALFLLGCDVRVGALGNYHFGLNETAINLPLPIFGLELAEARLARDRMVEAVLQARLYQAEEAVTVGYLDHAITPDKVIAESTNIARELAAIPSEAYNENKQLMRRQTLSTIAASLK